MILPVDFTMTGNQSKPRASGDDPTVFSAVNDAEP